MGKRAVVLAGGGSRGAYQIGVWRALRELGIDYQIVTGTSVGALNGAMMVQGDYEVAAALWETLLTSDVVNADLPDEAPDYSDPRWESEVWGVFLKKAIQGGGLDFSPLEGIMEKYISEERIRQSPVDFGVVTVEYPSMKALELAREEIPAGKIADYVMASAACFPAFKVKEIDRVKYIDGGYQDYMPVGLALRLGANEVIAVDLKAVGIRRKPKDSSVPVKLVRSRWNLGPFLLFEPTLSGRNMALGYLDAKKALGALDGDWFAFEKGSWQTQQAKLANKLDRLLALAEADGRDAPSRVGKLRLLRALGLGKGAVREALLLPAAELAGRLLKLPPERPYSCEAFDSRLLAAFADAKAEAAQQAARLADGSASLSELADVLRREGKQVLLSAVYALLSRALAGEKSAADFWRLAVAAPPELAAACYLWLLEQEGTESTGRFLEGKPSLAKLSCKDF